MPLVFLLLQTVCVTSQALYAYPDLIPKYSNLRFPVAFYDKAYIDPV
jgi:hypothetical protein